MEENEDDIMWENVSSVIARNLDNMYDYIKYPVFVWKLVSPFIDLNMKMNILMYGFNECTCSMHLLHV